MSKHKIAIIGSGIAGTTIAYLLTQRGHAVDIFEKGPDYPYPHTPQFGDAMALASSSDYRLPADLKSHVFSGSYRPPIENERFMNVGGKATRWAGITLRMSPNDFRRRSVSGYGDDWPITYDALEPYYCKAEELMGISGTADDNPSAPWRSKPYPLPPFPLSYDDHILADRLKSRDIVLHTTPQARTHDSYDDRPGCANFGICKYCPIGVRYSPNHHLRRVLDSGLGTLYPNTSVRRIVANRSGSVSGIVYQENDATQEKEHAANVVILAAGSIESARLLLLSTDSRRQNGIGNGSGHVGRHLLFHHIWAGNCQYDIDLYPGRFGGRTGECHQFMEPTEQGHGGIKVEFPSRPVFFESQNWKSAKDVVDIMRPMVRTRPVMLHAESVPSPDKSVTLADRRDRFGDPLAHVKYSSAPFDNKTYERARELFNLFAEASGATNTVWTNDPDGYDSGAHHLGTCRMGKTIKDGVVNSFGEVHELPNLFVAGEAISVGTTGAVNPTLTLVALAIRTAESLSERLK